MFDEGALWEVANGHRGDLTGRGSAVFTQWTTRGSVGSRAHHAVCAINCYGLKDGEDAARFLEKVADTHESKGGCT